MTPLVLTRKEAAATLRVSVWMLDRYIADGALKTLKLPSPKRPGKENRRVLIAMADLEEFVARHRDGAGK
jgi:hypothetical protein